MKRINPAEITTKTLGVLCGLAILGGGASLILGSSGSILIWTGDHLKPHQRTFRFLGLYGGLFCGGGLFLVGTASAMLQGAAQRAIAQHGAEKTADVDLEPWQHPVSPAETLACSVCARCHHYHGQAYGGNFLVCGMHPYGRSEGDCPDFRTGTSLNPTKDRFL
jgi:cytochrome c553